MAKRSSEEDCSDGSPHLGYDEDRCKETEADRLSNECEVS